METNIVSRNNGRMPKCWFDATTVLKMQRYGPVGLTRVEANTLAGALRMTTEQVSFCRFNRVTKSVEEVDRAIIVRVVEEYGQEKPLTRTKHRSAHPLRRLGRRIDHGYRVLIRNPIQRATRFMNHKANGVRFVSGDSFIVSGSTWDTLDPEWLKDICEQGVRLVVMLADMIPWKFPHQFHEQSAVTSFLAFANVLVNHASLVACISKATQLDFVEFAQTTGLYRNNSEVVLLGTDPPIHHSEDKIRDLVEGLPDDLLTHGFVLSVSTIQVRKNHQLLYNLWRRFAEEGRTDVPRLVLVGANGWLTEDLMAQIEKDPMVKDSIVVLNNTSDAGLSWLYENCGFTVYPSLYEGWGLPIAESLAHGKVCLASNTSSMPEAGQQLAVHLDPLDFKAWHDSIIDWIENPAVLTAFEKRIRDEFQQRSWDDFAADFIEQIVSVSNTRSQQMNAA
jgi:glycosyltransferase involved in cell wall biosynthesis